MYHGKRSGDNFDYHMWSVKVDHVGSAEGAGREGAADRPPQESDAPDFDGDELLGPLATDTGGESTLDDPNGELPY